MRVKILNDEVSGYSMFKLVWRGYFWGALTIFLPMLLFTVPLGLAAGFQGENLEVLLAVLVIPLILWLQGIIFGGIVSLGLVVRPPKE